MVDGEIKWEGWVDEDIQMHTEIVVKPVLKKPVWMWEDHPPDSSVNFETIQDKMIIINAALQKLEEKYAKGGIIPSGYQEMGFVDETYTFPPDPFGSVDHLIPQPSNAEVADALEAAADLFITKGWCKGALKFTPEQYLEAKAIDDEEDIIFDQMTGVQLP